MSMSMVRPYLFEVVNYDIERSEVTYGWPSFSEFFF